MQKLTLPFQFPLLLDHLKLHFKISVFYLMRFLNFHTKDSHKTHLQRQWSKESLICRHCKNSISVTGIKTNTDFFFFFSFSATCFYGCQCCCNVQMKVFLHPLLLKYFIWWLDSLNAVRNKCLPPSFLKKILCRTNGVCILKRDLECCFCFNLFLNASNYQCCLEIEFSLKAGGLNLTWDRYCFTCSI